MHPAMTLLHKLQTTVRSAIGRGIELHAPPTRPAPLAPARRPSLQNANQTTLLRPVACNFRPTAPNKPLRVVRVLESGQPRCNVGRMVISGRMTDVCAELDRLVAHEASLRQV
jgi:hypothetical protein